MSKRGKFVVIEGVDGCGKGTVMKHLEGVIPALFTREPGGTLLGEQLRGILLGVEMDSVTELLLFQSARNEHVRKMILPALLRGEHVISDRFDASTYAYQVMAGDVGRSQKLFHSMNDAITRLCRPDHYILLDLPVEISIARTQIRGQELTTFEKRPTEFFEAVRSGYDSFFLGNSGSDKKPHTKVDARKDIPTVCSEVEAIVRSIIDA
jgi:dTMP kinase